MERWSIGVMEYWSVGAMGGWSTGVLEHWALLGVKLQPPSPHRPTDSTVKAQSCPLCQIMPYPTCQFPRNNAPLNLPRCHEIPWRGTPSLHHSSPPSLQSSITPFFHSSTAPSSPAALPPGPKPSSSQKSPNSLTQLRKRGLQRRKVSD
jgi:hypothetical protein